MNNEVNDKSIKAMTKYLSFMLPAYLTLILKQYNLSMNICNRQIYYYLQSCIANDIHYHLHLQ